MKPISAVKCMAQSKVTVYAIRTDIVRKWDLSRLEQRMPERMRKADRFLFEKDRLLCLGAGILLHEALGISGEALIRYGKNGKPFAPGYPAFNLSHSGQWCLLAVGGNCLQIGVDVEEISERNVDIAPAVYTESELIWMKSDPVNRFYRLWTWKESLMKASGLGMQLEPQSFEVLPFAEGRSVYAAGQTWYAWADGMEGYTYSICADRPVHGAIWKEIRL